MAINRIHLNKLFDRNALRGDEEQDFRSRYEALLRERSILREEYQ